MINLKKILAFSSVVFALLFFVTPILAGNKDYDSDCEHNITDPYGILGTGTRAEIYGCKEIGNTGEEQGRYVLEGPATLFGFPSEYGTCRIDVKWNGDYGETPYLDWGTVYNHTKCENGYNEIWGDRFDAEDAYGSTPYVFSIGGQGSQIHP